MNFKETILILIFASAYINLLGQSQPPLEPTLYSVDEKIDNQIRNFHWADTGTLENSMLIKVLWDTNYLFNQTLDCFTRTFFNNDTIYVTGYMLGELGWGFQVALFNESCIAASFALSDSSVYKYNRDATDSVDLIFLPSVSKKVVLSKKPAFEKGETVAGLVELKSVPYYYTLLDGAFTIDIKAYFKTAEIKQSQ